MFTVRAKKVSVFALVLLVLSLVGLVLALTYIVKLGTTLIEHAQTVADHNARQQTYEELQSLSNRTATDRSALQTYILSEDETIDFLATIESMAVTQGVTLETNTLSVVEGGTFNTLKVNFSITGQEDDVRRMISILETLPYPSTIERLGITWGTNEQLDQVSSVVDLAVSLQKKS